MGYKHITALDGLRGIAALIVVISHYSNETGLFGGVLGSGGGQTGVMLFFVLAGFLMTHLHIGEQFTARNVGSYAIKRIARVYPFFVLVAALPALLIYLKFPGVVAMGDINTIPIYLRQIFLLERGSGVFWTIQIEVLFYACFLGIWALHRGIARPAVTLVMILSCLVGLAFHGFRFSVPFFGYLHYFLVGVASSLIVQISGASAYRSQILSCMGVVLLLSLPFTFPKTFLLLTGKEIDSWTSLVVLAQISLLFNFVIRDRRFLQAALSTRPLVWVGRISYSIYLLHLFILEALVSWTVPRDHHVLSFLVFFASVLGVSALSHKYLERPIQKFILRLPGMISRVFSSFLESVKTRPV
jgi:peptidoglycan/LPS O-acetylase OafA/YrhL